MTPTTRRRSAPDPRPVRERILDAALELLQEGGIQQLTQPRAAARAGVRQSHLTYYFPSRADLLEATAMRFVESLAGAVGTMGDRRSSRGIELGLAHLEKAIADPGHMRMFLGFLLEADRDPTVRAIVLRGVAHMEAAMAKLIGAPGGTEDARRALATAWGLGLYRFIQPPRPES
jgi:AcrR family transcriptional regulator